MNYADAVKAGLIDEEDEEYAWELKSGALARFTSAELLRELKERANRKVIQMRKRRTDGQAKI